MSIDEHAPATGNTGPIASAEQRIADTREQHIVITDLFERAHTRAKVSNGGSLAGFTLAVKDNIDIAGVHTTHGSILYGNESALATAPVVAALEAAGASTVAKVNLHEFAYGVSSANPHFGAVRNPTHPAHSPGGSSGGSAAAVAAGIARIALGTDTGGSVRIPAACAGVVGLRPRNGTLDQSGVGPLAPSFDTVGPIGATVADVETAWKALRGGGPVVPQGTHFGPDEPANDRLRPALASTGRLTDVRIGVVGDVDANALSTLDAQTQPFDIDIAAIQNDFWPPFRAEVSRTHAGTFPVLAESYDPNVAVKLAGARGVTSDQYAAAMGELAEHRAALMGAMDAAGLDALVTPTLGGRIPRADDDELLFRDELGWYAAPFSALNLAALAFGNLQLVGRTESDVLALGRTLEAAGLTPVAAPLS